MKQLNALLASCEYEVLREGKCQEVSGIIYDSRQVKDGSLFVCIVGAVSDGHSYAAQAIAKGATCLVVSRDITGELEESIGQSFGESKLLLTAEKLASTRILLVEDPRMTLAKLSAAWFDHPAEKLKVIGITGTKGKTTTTYLVRSILEEAGHKVGLIGTIEIIIGDTHIPAEHTTPESYLVQEYFSRMVEEGCDTVVMEVSSQALMLHRTAGFLFDYGIFTNLSPDHIGPAEHKDFDDYLHCKSLLFKQCKVGIVNGDDPHWQEVTKEHTCSIETYGFAADADYRAEDLKLTEGSGFLGIAFRASGKVSLDLELHAPGRFSVYNALCALAICHHFGVSTENMKTAIAAAKVKGRIEMIHVSDDFTLMIDYAHNAMSLQSLLETLKEYHPARLVCLFGCGGNRSRARRFEMGEVSGNLADLTVITSDNPRNEEPQAIIDDIKTGIAKTSGKYVEIPDRKEAIAYVIHNGQKGDLIVLAGKGHEDYQEIRGKKYPMDERVIIQEILDEDRKRGGQA
ncbi:MAG: UDP-N-acetylmuramoyl-L-alanyl-D-glutamate--2,6-diaminopimelate ligase [Lachnospiraceae bacterium]|nr:UDP-N-acetylmuramoyl-L-alanyl-D-glutamate--2,6-diaminopimelate ligase [Lachnospiraceae bacterium]